MYEGAEAELDVLVDAVAAHFDLTRAKGISDDEAVASLIGSLWASAGDRQVTATDAAVHYGMALYRLFTNRNRIAELEDTVAMMRTLDDIQQL